MKVTDCPKQPRRSYRKSYPPMLPEKEVTPQYIAGKQVELDDLLKKQAELNLQLGKSYDVNGRRNNQEARYLLEQLLVTLNRIATLKRDLARLKPVDNASIESNVVSIGSKVLIHTNEPGDHLGTWEEFVLGGDLDPECVLGKALLGLHVGEKFSYNIDGYHIHGHVGAIG